MSTEKEELDKLVLSLKEGDILQLKPFNDLPKSKLTITQIFDDSVGGYVKYDVDDSEAEYAELFSEDFDKIKGINIT